MFQKHKLAFGSVEWLNHAVERRTEEGLCFRNTKSAGAPVSCAFDLDHYRELLDAAKAGGYRFAFFEGEPREGDVILRHDVDLSLDAALRMAELEAEAGAAATYFLMTSSVFYNLSSEEGERALAGCASSATASASTPCIRTSTSTTGSTR